MLSSDTGIKPSTVHRYLNDIRTVINYTIEEVPLSNASTPSTS